MAATAKTAALLLATAIDQVSTLPKENPLGSNKQMYGEYIDTTNWFLYKDGSKTWIHKVNGFNWCTQFHDYCFIRAFGIDAARAMLYRPKYNNYGAVVKYTYNYYKSAGRTGKEPKEGCSIFFHNSQGLSHIGIVEKFDSTYVYTIEGNTSSPTDSHSYYVSSKKYRRSDSYIYGYGYPNYDAEPPKYDYIIGNTYTVVCTDPLNLRDAGKSEATRRGELYKGAKVLCEEIALDKYDNTWIRTGALWCCAKYGKEVYIK